jgi:hypothetical protein
LELSESFCDDLLVFGNSGLSEIILSDFELRLIEEIDISISIYQSRQYRNDLTKRDKRNIDRDHIIRLCGCEGTDIRILIRRHTSISSDTLMELECSDIDCIHMRYIMCEEYLSKTPSRGPDIQSCLM